MSGWTLLDADPIQGQTFHRPLDMSESFFVWSSLRNGASDGLFRLDLNTSEHFSDIEIVRAWLSTKRRFPLAGANIQLTSAPYCSTGPSFTAEPHFVVREHDLAIVRQHEIVFGQVTSAAEVEERVTKIFDGPRPLSNNMLTQLYVLRETRRNNALHLMVLTAHCITDLIAKTAFARVLLDTLARGGGCELAQVPLVKRLAMAIPPEEREPSQFSPARRRWRRAVAALICLSRTARLRGGHSLPRLPTSLTHHDTPRARGVCVSFTPAETNAVLANCHLHNVTFGTAYLVLAQVAMTRVIYRLYLRGHISEQEWEHRKKQPHSIRAPVNLRPYLDRAWFEGGGGGECVLSTGMNYLELPFMTLGETEKQYRPRVQGSVLGHEDSPPFSELLTFDRFLYRTGLVRTQMGDFFRHPLCFEILRATDRVRTMGIKANTVESVDKAAVIANENDTHETLNDDASRGTMVWAHAGSSFGNMDLSLPREYPLASTHPLSPFSRVPHPSKAGYMFPPRTPSPLSACSPTWVPPEAGGSQKISLETSFIHLHVRPGQLYLGTSTSGGQLSAFVYYDGNVFEEKVVKEWLDEFKDAVSWYLLRAHQSSRGETRQPAFSKRIKVNL